MFPRTDSLSKPETLGCPDLDWPSQAGRPEAPLVPDVVAFGGNTGLTIKVLASLRVCDHTASLMT